MGAIYPRVKNWVDDEILTNEDLNAEIDNILDNHDPSGMDDYSTNVTEMQTTTDPGEVGSESLATTLAGEIERLRFAIGEIKGTSQWYESGDTTINELNNVTGGGLPANRITSYAERSGSSQGAFLTPNGAADTLQLNGATTNFIYVVENTQYTISTNITATNLLTAPTSNNTALVNDATLADQKFTETLGEHGTTITIGTVGSEISSRIGELTAFRVDGVAAEYFIAEVLDSTTLGKARRGYFFDSSDNPIDRTAFSNGDTITIMKLTWVFATTAGALAVTYNNPVYSTDEPQSPATGDYWFDLVNEKWKTFDSAQFVDADATLIGVCIQDENDNTVGARGFEKFTTQSALNTLEIEYQSVTAVRNSVQGAEVSIFGSNIRYEFDEPEWGIGSDLDTGLTESSSTTYYLYLTETGDRVLSDVVPYDRRSDLLGYYHPHQTWRCVGSVFNDSSSDFDSQTVRNFNPQVTDGHINKMTAAGQVTRINNMLLGDATGGAFTMYLPDARYNKGQKIYAKKIDSSFNVITLEGALSQTIDGSTSKTLATQYERLTLVSDGSNYHIVDRYVDGSTQTFTPSFVNFTLGNGTVNIASYSRRGKWMRLNVDVTLGSTSSVSGNIAVTIPNSLTIDSSQIGADSGTFASVCSLLDSGSSNFMGIISLSSTNIRFDYIDDATGAVRALGTNATSPFTWTTNDSFVASVEIPITEWEG